MLLIAIGLSLAGYLAHDETTLAKQMFTITPDGYNGGIWMVGAPSPGLRPEILLAKQIESIKEYKR